MRLFRCFVRDCLVQEALSSPSEELSSLLSEELFDGSSSSFSTTVFFHEIEAVTVFGGLESHRSGRSVLSITYLSFLVGTVIVVVYIGEVH